VTKNREETTISFIWEIQNSLWIYSEMNVWKFVCFLKNSKKNLKDCPNYDELNILQFFNENSNFFGSLCLAIGIFLGFCGFFHLKVTFFILNSSILILFLLVFFSLLINKFNFFDLDHRIWSYLAWRSQSFFIELQIDNNCSFRLFGGIWSFKNQ